jgi:hypothetical protein
MSTAPRFLVAKYIPDLRKQEPKNIGIVLWAGGQVLSRFVGDDELHNSTQFYPNFVLKRNRPVYREWITHWRRLMSKETLPLQGRKTVPKSSADFLNALRLKSSGNFVLVEGGLFPVDIPKKDIGAIADGLFQEMVSEVERVEISEARSLQKRTNEFFSETNLKYRSNFAKNYRVQYDFRGVKRHVDFSYGISGEAGSIFVGSPTALFQTARLSDMRDVNNALFMLEGVAGNNGSSLLPKQCCFAVVHTGAAKDAENVDESLESLDKVGTVLDLSNLSQAVDTFHRCVPLLNGGDSGDGNGLPKHI